MIPFRISALFWTSFVLLAFSRQARAGELEDLAAQNEALVQEITALNEEVQALQAQRAHAETRGLRGKAVADALMRLKQAVETYLSGGARLTAEVIEQGTRHEAWIAAVRSMIKRQVPNWDSIVDLPSYRQAEGAIALFSAQLPDVSPLVARATLLKRRGDALEAKLLLAEIDALVKSPVFDEVLAKRAAGLRSRFEAFTIALAKLASSRVLMASLLDTQGKARERLVSEVIASWRRMAQSRLERANGRLVEQMDETYRRSVNDPKIYYAAKNAVAQATSQLAWTLNRSYSPYLARRKLHQLRALLDELSRKLPQLFVTEPTRRELEMVLIDGNSVHATYARAIEGRAQNDLALYATARANAARNELARQGGQVSAECQQLAERIEARQPTVDSELAYKEFTEQCMR